MPLFAARVDTMGLAEKALGWTLCRQGPQMPLSSPERLASLNPQRPCLAGEWPRGPGTRLHEAQLDPVSSAEPTSRSHLERRTINSTP